MVSAVQIKQAHQVYHVKGFSRTRKARNDLLLMMKFLLSRLQKMI